MVRKLIVLVGLVCIAVSLLIIVSKKQEKKAQATAPSSTQIAGELQEYAHSLEKNGEGQKAKEVYQKILTSYSDADNIDVIQKELETLNMEIIFSNKVVPEKAVLHEVITGDTLGELASKYNTTVDLIKACNNIKGDVIRVGQKLRIWTGQFNIFVDKSQNILILKDGNEIVKIYSVSTGENNSTPVGEFKIITKLIDPVWFNRGVVVPPESPQNVLGTRWLGFDYPGYGIHGTTEPETIGSQVTAGCVRMTNNDVEELFSIVPKGTQVVIVD